jgi:GT2 family glycosyltransferase
MSARFGCVVLTGGGRAAALERAVASLQAQEGVEVDVAVVFNGTPPTGLPTVARVVELPEPVGIPAGRNAGVAAVDGELLFFLDDDATLRDRDTLARVAALLEAQPAIGCVQLRVDVDAADASTPPARTWVPRLRVGDRTRSSDVAALWEGAVAIRRGLFEQVGGWPGDFRYVHEGVALAWSVMDAGFRVRYAGDLVALHPPLAPGAGRRPEWAYYAARNRVWLARRFLRLPLGVLFVATFLVRTAPTLLRAGLLRDALRGYRDGMRGSSGPRRKLKAATLWRMTRDGRPPII